MFQIPKGRQIDRIEPQAIAGLDQKGIVALSRVETLRGLADDIPAGRHREWRDNGRGRRQSAPRLPDAAAWAPGGAIS